MSLIPLPPYSPELNPAEQIWNLLRRDYFANRVFDSLDAATKQAQRGLADLDANPRVVQGKVDQGAYEGAVVMSIPDSKLAPDSTTANLMGVVVTRLYGDHFYVENADRSSGIRVKGSSAALTPNTRANIVGTLATNADGERYINAIGAASAGTGTVAPVGMTNKTLGGGDMDFNPATGTGQQGVAGGAGLNNIGLLVQTWGIVTASGTGYFYIDDGSGLYDGSGNTGLNVLLATGSSPATGSTVEVTGISSCFRTGTSLQRRLLVVDTSDITQLAP